MRGMLLGGLVLQLAGCQNACQELCGRMADYAEECGLPPVSEPDIQACVQRQSGSALDDGDRKVCRQFNDPVILRAEWQCEDLVDYFAAPAPEATSQIRREGVAASDG